MPAPCGPSSPSRFARVAPRRPSPTWRNSSNSRAGRRTTRNGRHASWHTSWRPPPTRNAPNAPWSSWAWRGGARRRGGGRSTPSPSLGCGIQARVLAMQATKGKSQEAIRLLEKSCERDPDAAEDRLVLARLFEIEGDWPKADAQMRWLVDNNPSVPSYLVRYILAILRNKRGGEAGPWLDRLEKLQPETPLVQQLRAMALSEQGKGDEAVGLLLAYAKKHEDQSGFVAQVLEVIGRAPAAEEVLRQYVARNQAKEPQSVLVLAEYLGRQGRTRKALDQCEAAWKTCPPELVADVCCGILLVADPDETQLRRVEGWFKDLIARQPANDKPQISMAMLRTVQGRYSEAETLYRQALSRNEGDVVALNNLAWLIAIKQEGKGAEALQLLGRAIDVAGPRAALLDTRAVIHMKMGRATWPSRIWNWPSPPSPRRPHVFPPRPGVPDGEAAGGRPGRIPGRSSTRPQAEQPRPARTSGVRPDRRRTRPEVKPDDRLQACRIRLARGRGAPTIAGEPLRSREVPGPVAPAPCRGSAAMLTHKSCAM